VDPGHTCRRGPPVPIILPKPLPTKTIRHASAYRYCWRPETARRLLRISALLLYGVRPAIAPLASSLGEMAAFERGVEEQPGPTNSVADEHFEHTLEARGGTNSPFWGFLRCRTTGAMSRADLIPAKLAPRWFWQRPVTRRSAHGRLPAGTQLFANFFCRGAERAGVDGSGWPLTFAYGLCQSRLTKICRQAPDRELVPAASLTTTV
jgi:hypothetical protein